MLVEDYLNNIPMLHSWDGGKTWSSGGFEPEHLRYIYDFLREQLGDNSILLETGAGNSTIIFLLLKPSKLLSIAPDAELFGRIRDYCQKNEIADAALEAHVDGSQWVLPRLAADNRAQEPFLDFALIDGCHGWPTAFVDLEYANAMLRKGGLIMIDDVQLHAEKEIACLLAELPGFSVALDIGKSIIFRKLTDQRFLGEWVGQPYIARRTEEYARNWPNPFALRQPSVLSRTAYWMKRLPHRVRDRLARPSVT